MVYKFMKKSRANAKAKQMRGKGYLSSVYKTKKGWACSVTRK